jgi:hypothetical protein
MAQDELPSFGPDQVSVVVEQFGESLTRWRARTAEIAPAELAGALSCVAPLYAIADLRKVETSLQEAITTKDFLFDWLDAVAAELISPVVLAQDKVNALPTLIPRGWGCGALILLFSRQDQPALLRHLRHCLHRGDAKTDSQGTPQGLVAYCWPAALAALLESETADFAPQFLRGIDAVLLEVPGESGWWQIYGGAAAAAALDEAIVGDKRNRGRRV